MADSYTIKAILSAVDNMSPVLQQAASNAQNFGNNVSKNYGAIGKTMVGIGAATTAMGVSSLKSFGQFQQSLNTAAVVAGGTAKDIDGLANGVVGEIDDPENQSQRPLVLSLDEGGLIVYGAAGSGKFTFVSALLYSLIRRRSPEELNVYIADFGAETFSAFRGTPHVGDVVL